MKRFIANLYFLIFGISFIIFNIVLLINHGESIFNKIVEAFVWLNNNMTLIVIISIASLFILPITVIGIVLFMINILINFIIVNINIGIYWHNLILPNEKSDYFPLFSPE